MSKYKHGKQTTPINFEEFRKIMDEGKFVKSSHKTFLAFLYWTGVRQSEALERVKEEGCKNVGLLASKKTIDSKMHENLMRKNEINVILPTEKEQDEISRIIVEILRNELTENNKNALKRIIKKLMKRGSETIILGCTDLQIVLNKNEVDVELLDSFEILLESTFQRIIGMGESE